MISRTVARSAKAPALRALPAAFRIASSTVWARHLAKHNRPNDNPREDTEFSRPAAAQSSPNPSSTASKYDKARHTTQNQHKPSSSSFSPRKDEFNKAALPDRNSASQSPPTQKGTSYPSPRKGDNSTVSFKHDEISSPNSRSDNIAPQASSPSSIDPMIAQNQPFPDLTKGIPSTLEYETAGSSTRAPLNLTEAEGGAGNIGGGGRGRGELPASAYISSSERKRLRFANIMYATFALLAVGGTVYLGRNWETEEEERQNQDAPSGWAFGLMWNRAKARLGQQLNYYKDPAFRKLLPDVNPMFERPYTLVLSLEDLLIHNEWSREHGWRLAKRPGVDYFIRYLSQYYELVIFTSQPWATADPVIRKLDPYHIVTWPLFREATLYEKGEYIKDLSYLNRDLSKVIVIDTKASHVQRQPENAIILQPWRGSAQDKELVSLIPFLEYIHTMAYTDVRKAIASFSGTHIPTEFARREAIARKKFKEQLEEEEKRRPKRSALGSLGGALGIKANSMVMTDPAEQTPAEAFAQGKMLQDQARERGQRNYEAMEKEIRENGEKWLKEEKDLEERAKQEGMKAMKSGFTGWFGGGAPKES